MKKRLQISQNKCIRFCLNLGSRESIGLTKFRDINWLPVEERVKQCICTLIYKYLHNNVPEYIKDIFNAKTKTHNTRNPNLMIRPFCTTKKGEKAISYQGPKLWEGIPIDLKEKSNVASFKHEFKNRFLEKFC